MVDEEDPDLELFGTSPSVIAFFMILISLIVPIGIILDNAAYIFGYGMFYTDFIIYGLIWSYTLKIHYSSFTFFKFILSNIWFSIPLTIFNVLYIRQIIRYYQGKCTRYSVIWVGLLSIVLPTLVHRT